MNNRINGLKASFNFKKKKIFFTGFHVLLQNHLRGS